MKIGLDWLLLAGSLIFAKPAVAREYYSTEVEASLYRQSIEHQTPELVGGPLRWIYSFSDDGVIVYENNLLQRGVSNAESSSKNY